VRYACVIARADQAAGQLAKAIVELHPGQVAAAPELLAHARTILGADAPTLVEIIAKMPMTPTGKLARAELQARENSI
jgi:acyl-coenzyme A synthetase/AMP-(fatty) acid ligase